MNIPDERPSLNWVLDHAWQQLDQGVLEARHAFHCPALASVSSSGPSVRTVVLREASRAENVLACHTDRRAPKFAELTERPRASWLFYDAQNKVQLRAFGSVNLHQGDELASERWQASAHRSRACYQAVNGPGTRVSPDQAQPPDTDEGFDRFVVVRCRLDALDWLYLRGKGHWRARFDWHDKNWQGSWIAP